MNKVETFIALAMGYLVGHILYNNPFPAEVTNFIIAILAGIMVYKQFKDDFTKEKNENKEEI